MTSQELMDALSVTLTTHWRIRAGVAAYRHTNSLDSTIGHQILNYANVPFQSTLPRNLIDEPLTDALNAVSHFSTAGGLNKATFLSLVAVVEEFLSAKLAAKSQNPEGTFGNLQSRAEIAYGVSGLSCELVSEIREYRNCIIHHNGHLTARYIAAANIVLGRDGGAVLNPTSINVLKIPDNYLSHCVIVFSAYAALFS